MTDIRQQLDTLDLDSSIDKLTLVDQLEHIAHDYGYETVDRNDTKPWGAYLRFDSKSAEQFINSFFPGLTLAEAQLGIKDAELSPKFLLVAPGQRLSWQMHDRRAERWAFLTDGAYQKSATDEQGDIVHVTPGKVVQFAKGERHRLVGINDSYALVAEIWQHSDPAYLSDEDDIVRLQDDYSR
jgi:mannose-6-phosphate isomerase